MSVIEKSANYTTLFQSHKMAAANKANKNKRIKVKGDVKGDGSILSI